MKYAFLIISLLLTPPALADRYQDEIDRFFKLYEAGKPLEAVDALYSTNEWVSAKSDAILNVKNQLVGLEKLVGKYLGKTKIGENNIANRFIHVTYLAMYDRQPIRIEFQFYRPQKEWRIFSFSFDDKFTDEVEIASRNKITGGGK